MAENSNVQDAFVIAVEQQARERLEKLSALRKIKPVDMTALSQQVENKISNHQSSNTNQISWSLRSGKLVLICSDLPRGS